MHRELPIALEREPLVDAVFEVRFKDTPPLADILPGFLMAQLDPKPTITRLPAAAIPHPMRANDPSLQFVPTLRLEWEQYVISIGDQNVVISCKLPYPKWPNFKPAIISIIQHIAKANIVGQVERYSVKYVNLIQAPTLAEQAKKIMLEIKLGDIQVDDDHMMLQVHRIEGEIVHILSVKTGAQVQIPAGNQLFGAIVDIDSIRKINAPDFNSFIVDLEQGVEELRQANKAKFFSCLTEAAIEEMGPKYE